MVQAKLLKYQLLIDGEWQPSASGEQFQVENPANGETVALKTSATPDDVAAAVTPADEAFRRGPWSQPHDRRRSGAHPVEDGRPG